MLSSKEAVYVMGSLSLEDSVQEISLVSSLCLE